MEPTPGYEHCTDPGDAAQLTEALKVADDEGLPRYRVLQPGYNLLERKTLEGPLLDLCRAENLGVITYFSLALSLIHI